MFTIKLKPYNNPYLLPILLSTNTTGNGNKIIRCEVSLDDGETWKLTTISRRFEENPASGKHWPWVWWEIDVPIGKFVIIILISGYTLYKEEKKKKR